MPQISNIGLSFNFMLKNGIFFVIIILYIMYIVISQSTNYRDEMQGFTTNSDQDQATGHRCLFFSSVMLNYPIPGCRSIKSYDHYSLKNTFHKRPTNCS